MTKRWKSLLTLSLLTPIISLMALAYPGLVVAQPPAQGPTIDWIIWEMAQPPQSLLLDGDTLWAGSYKGGLYQWDVETGYQAHYTTTHGLAGEDIVNLVRANEGNILAAAVDGGLAVGGSPFTNLTPPGGKRAWDVAVTANDDIWLASLGGGVAWRSSGSWTVYTTTNSALPFDDVYAIALEGSTPWIGTIGYGLARLEGSDWVTYTLPVSLPHPVTPTTQIINNAITDIAVDGNGNKWLATDGSGVVVLDSSNTNWTVYDTGNSDLPDDFVHSITLSGSDRWFGTLGGGAARLSDGAWQVYNTSNSLLPEDDVLAVAIDANGGQWFATFDTGLTYHGPLPATLPTLDLAPWRAPEYTPGGAKSYYLWLDPDTYIWYLAWSGDGQAHTFEGSLIASSSILTATALDFEGSDSLDLNGSTLTVSATEAISQDLVSFVLDRSVTQLIFNLKIDGAYRPFNIRVGEAAELPSTAPFRLLPPQPIPPTVMVEAQSPMEEGDVVFVTATLTDTDSPIGHHITWDMDDGTVITGTLAPQHTYLDEGLYNATLTITDVHNEISSAGAPITVNNVAPEVDFFSDPARPEPGQVLTFTGSIFDPGLDDTHTYQWDFGDGNAATDSLTVSHTYAATGTYDVTLTVTDNDGGVGVISYPVSIEPFGADFTGYPGVGLPPFTATFYDISSGIVTSRTWDFGDGSPAVTTDTTTIEHVYEAPGIYTVSLTVDGPSGTDTTTRPGYIIAVSPITSGTILLEAEDYSRQLPNPSDPGWETQTALLGYSGSGYVQAAPDVDIRFDDANPVLGAELQYDLGLTITGTYAVWLRGYAPNAAGDSVYVGLNGLLIGNTEYVSDYPPRTWAWGQNLVESRQPVTFTIESPGVHTLSLWVREDGFSLDQIILTTDDNFAPSD
ncbi:MAG: PKD domain-containing protein [Anaerolineae bacterium]|nr:PKD domain-containing protein [Anaerolineae bacterium]